jgi:hypothetical protein
MEIPEGHKKCTKCLEVKAFSEFYKKKSNKDGLQYNCKLCDFFKKKQWEKDNKEKKAIQDQKYRLKHPEKSQESWKKKQKKAIENLEDSYIKKKLTERNNLKASDIPQEMLDLKRIQLQIHRHLKEMQNERN